jgi:hypothetical protein
MASKLRSVGFLLALCLFGYSSQAQASSIIFDLNCIIGQNGPSGVSCGVPSFGTVTLSDSPGNGDILVTVDLVPLSSGSGPNKFKDLFFNYAGSAAAITAGSSTTDLLDPDNVAHAPYTGKFDVNDSAGSATSEPFSITFYGWNATGVGFNGSNSAGASNVNLLLNDFKVFDSLGQTYLSIHIQEINCPGGAPADCQPGVGGGGSVNAAGSNSFRTTNGGGDDETPVPEPGSLILLGTGLALAARKLRTRTRNS